MTPFENVTSDQLVEQYGDMESARKAMFVQMAGAFIDHFKTYASLSVPGLGLAAGSTPVAGTSTTGKIS